MTRFPPSGQDDVPDTVIYFGLAFVVVIIAAVWRFAALID